MNYAILRLSDSQANAAPSPLIWRDSRFVCALTDGERHLGHAIRYDDWHVFDATHANESNDGIAFVGRFSNIGEAKHALARAVGQTRERALSAGSAPKLF